MPVDMALPDEEIVIAPTAALAVVIASVTNTVVPPFVDRETCAVGLGVTVTVATALEGL